MYEFEIKVTPKSKFQLAEVSLSVADLRALLPICIGGLPDDGIPADMRNVIESLVCMSVNPIRPSFEESVGVNP